MLGATLFGALPETLEVIELPGRHLHDVNDHIAEVQQGPFAAVQPFAAERAHALLLDLLQDVLGQRLDLAAGGTAGNHHVIGNAGLAPYIDDHDVLAFQIFQRGNRQLDQCFILHKGKQPQFDARYSPCALI